MGLAQQTVHELAHTSIIGVLFVHATMVFLRRTERGSRLLDNSAARAARLHARVLNSLDRCTCDCLVPGFGAAPSSRDVDDEIAPNADFLLMPLISESGRDPEEAGPYHRMEQ